ncbi:MAG TPA: FAD:protein FMN transferase [Thermoanaerobaculia bacterium]|nr:FAD:protein FMN transferase [Thermoanaerobaculia bacterium]
MKRATFVALTFVAAALVGARLDYEPVAATVERRVASMGTTLDLVVRMKYRDQALEASEAALREVQRVEALLTTWKPGGELARVDAAPPGKPVAVSAELVETLDAVFAWVPRTDGAFDPTVLPLMRAWGLRENGRIPTAEELAAARAAVGPAHVRIDVPGRTVTRLSAEAGIDEGAWGKGYGLDRAARALAKAGVRSALLDLGGQVFAVGDDTGEKPWRVPVADPRDRTRTVLELGISDASASTSGDSERFREVAGRRIGHLLDPHTGEPAPDFGSVTVIAPTGLVADILSTAFFVLGPERGLSLSETLRRQGVEQEVLFLVVRGDHLEATASPGIPNIVLTADPRAVRGLTTITP